MLIFYLFSILLSVSIPTAALAKDNPNYDRYNPYTKHDVSKNHVSTAPELRSIVDENNIAEDEDEIFSDDTSSISSDDADSSQIHGPIGSICAELAQYCSYFATNMMQDARQQENSNSLILFSSVLELMADLSDKEDTPVRAETYASDIISVVTAMRNAFNADISMTDDSDRYPLLQKLFFLQERSESGNNDLDIELGIYMHNMLRDPVTAKPLVGTLFEELNTYAKTKAHKVLDIFHHDARRLLSLTLRPTDNTDLHRGPLTRSGTQEGRHMRQMSWLCHHAAGTCLDLADSLQNNTMLSHAAPLVQQLQAMLSAMSLTYDHLGAGQAGVRSHDRHELATQFAFMIHLLPSTGTYRSAHSPESAFLDQCTTLKSAEDKQRFVEEAFSVELDRDALLAEFFPVFERTINNNLETFSGALSLFTTQTLSSCYWHSPHAS